MTWRRIVRRHQVVRHVGMFQSVRAIRRTKVELECGHKVEFPHKEGLRRKRVRCRQCANADKKT